MARRYTAREIMRMLTDDGWVLHSIVGAHHQLEHPTRKGRVTVTVHGNKTLNPRDVASIFRQAGWR